MKNFLKSSLSFLASLIVVFIFFWMFATTLESALKKEEKRECIQWQQQAKELRKDLFFLTLQQKLQCSRIGIMIDAQVKKGVI